MLNRSDKRSSATRRARSLLLWLVCFSILLQVLNRYGVLDPLTDQTSQVLAPVQRGLTNARQAVGDALSGLGGSSELQRENQALKEELTRLQNENLALRTYEAENVQLRRTAGMREQHGWRTVIATVIGRSPDSATRMLTIDRGRADGLERGMAVVAHVGGSPDALIGLIDSLNERTASVLLITDARSIISGQILHKDPETNAITQPTGEVLGQWQLGSRLVMGKIERNAALDVGDAVLTAGVSQSLLADAPAARVPPNIPIGQVVGKRPSGYEQKVEVQPYFDAEQVRTVWIIVGTE